MSSSSSSSNYCVICLVPNVPGIEIFSEHGKELDIGAILSQHFWFKITYTEDVFHFVCFECWSQTQTFHSFYKAIENTHRDYFAKGIVHSKDTNNLPASSNDNLTQPIVLDANLRIVETILAEGEDECCENEHFVACDDILITNDGLTDANYHNVKINQKIDLATDTSRNNKQIKSETTEDIFGAGDGKDNHLNNGIDNSEFDSSEERSTKDAELIIPSYFDTSCDQCHAIFQTLSEARTHYIDQHGSFNGYIKCCGKRFKKRSHIADHIQWHQNPNSFMCMECNPYKSFNAKHRLAAHMLRHEPEESKKFQCITCEKRFSKKFLLNKHISLVHSNENQDIVCHLCNKKFKLPVTLKHHIASVHERAYLAVCEICAKTYKTKQGFREHLLTHNDTDETRVQCTYCKAMLKNRVSLKTHIRRTHKSSPRKCPHCQKVKPNQQSLASHILVVHSKPSHQCTICDRSFTKALSLTEHIASHCGQKLYTCKYCSRMFASNSNTYKHQKLSHPEQWSIDRKRKTA